MVEALFVYEPDGETPHVAIPHPETDVLLRFGPAARNGLDAHAFGARERVHRKLPRGVQRIVTARLRLGASEAVLGVPASQLARRIVALEELWGDAATRRLFERLAGTTDALQATKIFEEVIAERLARARTPRATSPLALEAARKLGNARVNEVADELGVSERHLRRIFRETVGLGPKAYAKLARFRRALGAARENEAAGWADIASIAGYYDQAHLIAEFRAVAETTPRALLGELRTAPAIG